jgi:tetratricopeptide (TPR) repeat protein
VHEANTDAFDWSLQKVTASNRLKFKNEKDQKAWKYWFERGLKEFNHDNYEQAEISLKKAYRVNAHPLEVKNLLYQTYLKLEKPARAKELLEKQLLLKDRVRGGHPWKTVALKRIANQNQVYFVPLQEKLEEYTSNGILGKELFLDDCHPNFLGHKIIASVMMQALCDSNFISCANRNWRKWLDKFSGEMDDENLAKEYFLVGYYQFKGTVWADEPNYSKALEYFNRAIELDPKDKQVYGFLAATYWQLGNKDEAVETFEQLQKEDAEEAKRTLKRFPYLKEIKA